MPCPFKLLAVLFDQTLDTVEGPCVEAVIVGHHHGRREPEFGFVPTLADVDMDRLTRIALVRVEVKLEAIEAQDDRHQERPSRRDHRLREASATYSPGSMSVGVGAGVSGTRSGAGR